MPKKKRSPPVSTDQFIAVIMQCRTLREAAAVLGVSPQAVSARVRRYREWGVKGLPVFEKHPNGAKRVQELVNQAKGNK
jgi:transposase